MSAATPGTPLPADELGRKCAEAINPHRFEPMVRRASEDIYERLMHDVQSYLKDNIEFNISAEIDCARIEIARLRKENADLLALVKKMAGISRSILAEADDLDLIAMPSLDRLRATLTEATAIMGEGK